jgi:phage terminase Nu1 subunit (DNA packaging protein)
LFTVTAEPLVPASQSVQNVTFLPRNIRKTRENYMKSEEKHTKTTIKYLNQNSMARLLGVSVPTLKTWRREKDCPAIVKKNEVLYDVKVVMAWAKIHREKKDIGSSETNDFSKARTKRENFKAKLAELEFLERSGELLPIKLVEAEAETLYRNYRDKALNIIIIASKKLLGETDEEKFERVLRKEIELAIERKYGVVNGVKI